MIQEELRRHAAAAALRLTRSGVLVVRLRGPVTAETLIDFRDVIVKRYAGRVSAFVADYRCAALVLDGNGLDDVLNGAGQPVPRLPAALLVAAADVDLFAGHALRMASQGVMRRVFVDAAPALGWAEAEAARAASRAA